MSETARPKLRWSTGFEAYRVTWRFRRDVLRMSWAWLLIIVPVTATLTWILFPVTGDSLTGRPSALFIGMLPELIGMIAGASIAVACHRLVLAGERPDAKSYLRLDSVVMNYFVIATIVSALVLAPILLGGNFLDTSEPATVSDNTASNAPESTDGHEASKAWSGCSICVAVLAASAVIISAGFAVLLYVPLRISLALPAIAIGRNTRAIRKSWSATRRNYVRLFVGSTVSTLPICLLSILLVFGIVGTETTRFASSVGSAIGTILGFTIGMVSITFLSLAYAQLQQSSHATT